MITLKLNPYTNRDVDLLTQAVESALSTVVNQSDANCGLSGECETCKLKLVCSDLMRLQDYLIEEANNSYPHCHE